MDAAPVEVILRWRVFRLAVMAGWDWTGTYDWCLHPATRAPLTELLEHYPAAASTPEPPGRAAPRHPSR